MDAGKGYAQYMMASTDHYGPIRGPARDDSSYLCALTSQRHTATVPISNRYNDLLTDEDFPELSNLTTPKKKPLQAFPQRPTQKSNKQLRREHALNCLTEVDHEPVNAVTQRGTWELIETMLDSGASSSVAPASMAGSVPTKPSLGSQRGQHFYAANGDKIPNLGEKTVNVETELGQAYSMTFQVADVVRPLTSVSKICDAANGKNEVVFTANGGYIWHDTDKSYTPFSRENGIYVLRTWLSNDGNQSFTRQGR